MKKQVQIGMTIDNVQNAFLKEMSEKRRMSKSEVVRQIVNDDMEAPDMDIWFRREMEVLPLRFYDDQAAHIERLRSASNLTRTEVIRILIDRAIARNKDTVP